MKKLAIAALAAIGALVACNTPSADLPASAFAHVEGENIILPNGEKLFIRGTNLGNWLNPEGYMFGFNRANSYRMINDVVCELVGPDAAADFWKGFKDNYITRADIEFIAATGANTIRMPFHYKLFTDEDYMGLSGGGDGFARLDSVVGWCADNSIYVILDMHDAPGGQTGDNIDDSYGYPWLFESEKAQQQFCDIWQKIAEHYRNEPAILGYDLINEPIAPYFDNVDSLNNLLEPLHKRAVEAIRKVDPNHIVIIGAPQWNSNFRPFTDWTYDDNLMFTCHRYGGPAIAEAIQGFIAFRDSTGRPMYMGEIGHNTPEWQADFCKVMEDNNIGYTFWPYKKIHNSSFVGFNAPAEWDSICAYANSPRSSFAEARAARPDRQLAARALNALLDSVKLTHCTIDSAYILSLGLSIPE